MSGGEKERKLEGFLGGNPGTWRGIPHHHPILVGSEPTPAAWPVGHRGTVRTIYPIYGLTHIYDLRRKRRQEEAIVEAHSELSRLGMLRRILHGNVHNLGVS